MFSSVSSKKSVYLILSQKHPYRRILFAILKPKPAKTMLTTLKLTRSLLVHLLEAQNKVLKIGTTHLHIVQINPAKAPWGNLYRYFFLSEKIQELCVWPNTIFITKRGKVITKRGNYTKRSTTSTKNVWEFPFHQ